MVSATFGALLLLAYGCGQSSDLAGLSGNTQGTQGSEPANGVLARFASPSSTASPYYPPSTATNVAPSANGRGYYPSLSYDGRYLAFTTNSSNLYAGAGARANNPSLTDGLVKDQSTGAYDYVTRPSGMTQFANGSTVRVSISNDGSKVLFASQANNLALDPIQGQGLPPVFANSGNTYVRTIATDLTTLISINGGAAMGGCTSANMGASRFGLFTSSSTLFLKDTQVGTLVNLGPLTNGWPYYGANQAVDNGGSRVLIDHTVRNVANGSPILTTSDWTSSLSGDGNWVTTYAFAGQSVTVTLRNVNTGAAQVAGVSASNYLFWENELSDDGRYVALPLYDQAAVAGDSNQAYDIYVYDRVSQTRRRVSTSPTGVNSLHPTISGSGNTISWVEVTNNGPEFGGKIMVRKNPFF